MKLKQTEKQRYSVPFSFDSMKLNANVEFVGLNSILPRTPAARFHFGPKCLPTLSRSYSSYLAEPVVCFSTSHRVETVAETFRFPLWFILYFRFYIYKIAQEEVN